VQIAFPLEDGLHDPRMPAQAFEQLRSLPRVAGDAVDSLGPLRQAGRSVHVREVDPLAAVDPVEDAVRVGSEPRLEAVGMGQAPGEPRGGDHGSKADFARIHRSRLGSDGGPNLAFDAVGSDDDVCCGRFPGLEGEEDGLRAFRDP